MLAGFVAILLCSNLIGPGKACELDAAVRVAVHRCDARVRRGQHLFPISYIFDDVLTEVYGYAHARRVIWAGFIAMLFATLMCRRRDRAAADTHGAVQRDAPARVASRVRQHLADRACIDPRLLGRRLRQRLRACEDEDLDERPLALDADDRLDDRRRGRRQRHLLSDRVCRASGRAKR